jgi:hypothetical protein
MWISRFRKRVDSTVFANEPVGQLGPPAFSIKQAASEDPSLTIDWEMRLEGPILEAPLYLAGRGEALKQGLGIANDVFDYRRGESLFAISRPEDIPLLATFVHAGKFRQM